MQGLENVWSDAATVFEPKKNRSKGSASSRAESREGERANKEKTLRRQFAESGKSVSGAAKDRRNVMIKMIY